jgi:hypothetical protein
MGEPDANYISENLHIQVRIIIRFEVYWCHVVWQIGISVLEELVVSIFTVGHLLS